MKNLIIIVTYFLFSIVNCSAQHKNDTDSLINISIKKHIISKEQLIKEITSNPSRKIVFFRDNFSSGFEFPKSDKSKVTFLDYTLYSKKELKTGIVVFRLLPIILKGNTLSVTISNDFVTKKGNDVNISVSTGSIYRYQYSCTKERWELLSVQDYGI